MLSALGIYEHKMKKIILMTILVAFGISACDQKSKNAATHDENTKNQKIVVGDKIVVSNEMQNKNINILAENTNLSKNNAYYYQLTIENTGTQPININSKHIKLIDTKGGEHAVGLTDRELTEPLDPK